LVLGEQEQAVQQQQPQMQMQMATVIEAGGWSLRRRWSCWSLSDSSCTMAECLLG
jgi:hypothetical protein